jgi:hypothetical protein
MSMTYKQKTEGLALLSKSKPPRHLHSTSILTTTIIDIMDCSLHRGCSFLG